MKLYVDLLKVKAPWLCFFELVCDRKILHIFHFWRYSFLC